MEEKEIDLVLADDLTNGDLILVPGGGFQTVKSTQPDESDNDFIIIDTDVEEGAWTLPWDQKVSLYGY